MNNIPPIIVDLIQKFNSETNQHIKHNIFCTLDLIKRAIELATEKYRKEYFTAKEKDFKERFNIPESRLIGKK